MIEKARRILKVIDLANEKLAWIGGCVLLFAMVLVPYEVVSGMSSTVPHHGQWR